MFVHVQSFYSDLLDHIRAIVSGGLVHSKISREEMLSGLAAIKGCVPLVLLSVGGSLDRRLTKSVIAGK